MQTLSTFFAPAERDNYQSVTAQSYIFRNHKILNDVLNAIPTIGMILNSHRQCVFTNKHLIELVGVSGLERLIGRRPGEILNCKNASLEHGGCGTSEYCRLCDAARVILQSFKTGEETSGECRISSGINGACEALDFKCVATPLFMNDENFIILSLLDIAHEKRRRALEKIFFHDLTNTATGLNGFISYLKNASNNEGTQPQIEIIQRLSNNLIDEIVAQRELCDAENNELHPRSQDVYSLDLLSDVINNMAWHSSARNKMIDIDEESDNIRFTSDASLIQRVLINMLKNALEASPENAEIWVGCRDTGSDIVFWVKNPGVIRPDIQQQIFMRSFSTKGSNRGLGTYSMKLLTEKYLGGRISFVSNVSLQTVFYLKIPNLERPKKIKDE